jgi:choline dehydrogenase-like flavoprotein
MRQAPEADIAIVGAGAAGSLLAAKLAQAGKKTVVLEAGPAWRSDDLFSSQLWARRLKWSAGPVIASGRDPIGNGFNAGFGVGGAALHHYANWFRLHSEDFTEATAYGRGLDWPIRYEDLRPYYDRIQREVGLSGDAAAEVWRPPGEPYPMPPLRNFRQGELIARGFAALGLRTAPTPHAINSVEYGGRPACIYDGWCDAGCPIGALANPLVLYLPQAQRAGAEIRPWSYATRVLTNRQGTRATGVVYRDREGEDRLQPASVIVLAAFAVQTPRLLLNSATCRHPKGLSNASGTVGRYMMVHISGTVYGLFDEETEPYMGVTGGSLMSQEAYAEKKKRDYFGSRQWLIAGALKPNDLLGIANSRTELFGAALHDFMAEAAQRIGSMTLLGEDQPLAENRVTVLSEKDGFGVPIARTTHRFAQDTLNLYGAAMAEGVNILRAAGAREVWHGPMAQQHILGGTIMGSDSRTSVTNSYGQSHDIPNLFVAGSGLFPTSGAVNPTFTIHALALRTADFALSHWGSIAA